MIAPKAAIIIQGPLVSFGQGPNDAPGGYGTARDILNNVAKITALGYPYVVSTWTPRNEEDRRAADALRRAGVELLFNDPPPVSDPDHRHKHRWGIQRGIRALADRAIEPMHLLKIRTDMTMPDSFWAWTEQLMGRGAGDRLYVSELMPMPFYMGDFIYFGRSEIVSAFVDAICSYEGRIIHPMIATDDGIKLFTMRQPKPFGRRVHSFLTVFAHFVYRRAKLRCWWAEFSSRHLGVMPPEVWRDIVWRGRRIGSFLNSSNFAFVPGTVADTQPRPRKAARDLLKAYSAYSRKKRGRQPAWINALDRARRAVRHAKRVLREVFFPPLAVGGRIACVGKDLLTVRFPRNTIDLANVQKGRVDLLLRWIARGSSEVRAFEVAPYLKRADVFPLIEEQQTLPILKKGGWKYFVFDTYSDLTDQKFTHRTEGWSFCSHYTDLEHSEEFKRTFECEGLLDLARLEELYLEFFDWLRASSPGICISVVHYSAKYDERELFRARASEILRVLTDIAKRHPDILNLMVDESQILPHENDSFPYHYSRQTLQALNARWRALERGGSH